MAFKKSVDIYKTDYVHVYINQCHNPGKKTNLFTVRRNNKSGLAHLLGIICWDGAWRQYIFMPCPDTRWSSSCLQGITDFIKKINKEHREKLRKKNG